MPQPIKYGGLVSIDNLEAQRRSGQVTDDQIADAMAQASPTIASRLSKVRQRFAGDPAATTAFLNTHFYGMADHNPDNPKGLIGRSLDRIYENYKKDITDIGQSLENYQQGKQGAFDTIAQTAGNVASIGYSPLAQPFQEGVATAGRAAMQIPGVSGAVQDIAQSDFVQKGVIPTIQSASGVLSAESQRNPALRTLGAAGEALLDAGDAYAGGVIGGGALKLGGRAASAGFEAAKNAPQTLGKAVGAVGRGIGKPIGQFGRGVVQGFTGQTDNAASAVASQADNAVKELTGVAKEAVDKGLDEKLVTFAASQNPDTRAAMAQMTRLANKGAQKLGGDTAHKEVLGGYMLNNMSHILETKQNVGKAIGAMKMGMADDVIDMTDDFENLMTILRDKGAVISDTGKITRLMAESDDNIPLLQQALDFLTPSDTGRVARRFKDADMWRSKMFKEMNSAKAKLQPSSAGQSSLGFAEKVVNDLRRSAIKKMSKNNPRFLAYNDAYENLSTEASKFLKAIGYKGKLSIDDISAKDLKAGEVALRTLGNASADVRDSFSSMLKTARKYGYNSNVDEMQLIRYADALEDLYPITPTRSLQGGVSRGTKDALGNFTEDVLRSGVKRGAVNSGIDAVMGKIQTMRGMTPENQYRLLMQILESPPDTPFFKIADAVLPDELADDIAKGTQGIDAGDIAPAAKVELEHAGIKALKKQGLTDDEIRALTPEERNLGMTGGSDSSGFSGKRPETWDQSDMATAVQEYQKMPLKELRKHQDMIEQQLEAAYKQKNEAALTGIQNRQRVITEAINQKEFSPQPQAQKAVNGGSVGGMKYPMEDKGKWYGESDFESRGGQLITMSPDDFLKASKPLEIDGTAREAIDDLKNHIGAGKKLDPLTRYDIDTTDVKSTDGRHRAIAAKELGIQEVPVVDYTANQPTKAQPVTKASSITKELQPLAKEAKQYKSPEAFIDGLRRIKLSEVDDKLKEAFDSVTGGKNVVEKLKEFWHEATGSKPTSPKPQGKPTPIPGTNLNVEDLPF